MPDYKYICLDCGYQFDEPREYVETHGLDTPPYEHLSCCPVCGGGYDEAVECSDCGAAVPMSEAQELPNGDWLCENCYRGDPAAQDYIG